MNPSTVFQLAAQNPHEWIFAQSEFQSTLNSNVWSTVKDASAAAAIAANTLYGVLELTSAATTDNDGATVQSVQNFVQLQSGKRFALQAECKLSDATQMDFFFGLCAKVATNPEDCLTTNARCGFQKDDDSTNIYAQSSTNATTANTKIDTQLTVSDDTYRKLAITYDGSRLFYWVDGVGVAVISVNIPSATAMAILMFSLSGNNTGTKKASVRNLNCAFEI